MTNADIIRIDYTLTTLSFADGGDPAAVDLVVSILNNRLSAAFPHAIVDVSVDRRNTSADSSNRVVWTDGDEMNVDYLRNVDLVNDVILASFNDYAAGATI